jgi:homoserine kinase type II
MAAFTPLTAPEARSLARDHDLGTVTNVVSIAAGSVNSNFEIATERNGTASRWFLRIYEEQGLEGARYDADLLAHLAQNGVPTPRPVPTSEGGVVSTVKNKPAAIFPFIPGVHTCQRAVDAARCDALGEALARVHVAGATFPQRRAGRFTLDDLQKRFPRIAHASDPALSAMARTLEGLLAHWKMQRIDGLPEGVIHGDLFRDNVLFAEAEGARHAEIVALLDFESASDGRLAYDLAVTILAWCYGDALDLDLARAIIGGYERVRKLEKDERSGLRAELALAALRFTTTRITDYAMPRPGVGDRVIKDWRRFWSRFSAIESSDLAL